MDGHESMARSRGEAGFTLIEVLVAVAIVGLIGAAILTVFQASVAQVNQATALEDAQSSTRIVIDQMSRELRLAGSYYNGVNGAGAAAFTAATATSITFLGDVDGDTVNAGAETTLTANATATTLVVSSATGFDVYSTAGLNDWVYVANGSTREVKQIAASGVVGTTITLASALTNFASYTAGANSIVRSVETVTYTYNAGTLTRQLGGNAADTLLTGITSFALSYLDANGNALAPPPTLTSIREVQITITTGATGSTYRRTMESRVRLRN